MPIRHEFVSPKTDLGVTDEISPTDWNADHVGGVGADARSLRIGDDLFTSVSPWAGGLVSSTSSGSLGQAFSLVDHPGIVQASTGTSSAGRAAIISATAAGFVLGGGSLEFGSVVRVTTQLSSGTERYKVESGFGSGTSAGGGNGPQLSYIDNVNGGNWTAESRTSGADSAVDTGIAVVLNTWYKLEVRVNAAATEIEYYIDDSLVHTETTNIETTAVLQMVPIGIFKSVGTTSRSVQIDAFWYEWLATTPR